jgi:cell division protease FtsH
MLVMLGGRAAEEVAIGEITTGASDDLRRVTGLARRMVSQFGMSEAIGRINFGEDERQPFLGYSLSQGRTYSEETAAKIDAEVRRLVEDAYARTVTLLKENKGRLDALANELLHSEIVERAKVEEIAGITGITPPIPDPVPSM